MHVCYTCAMTRPISVRDLRNTVVDRRPVAEIVPLRRRRTVPVAEALGVASRHAADRGLLDDVRHAIVDTTDDV